MIKNGLSILLASLLATVLSPPPATAGPEQPKPDPASAELRRRWLPPDAAPTVPPVRASLRERTVARPGSAPETTREIPVSRFDPRSRSLSYPLIRRAYRSAYGDLLGVRLATPPPPPSPVPTPSAPPTPPPGPTPDTAAAGSSPSPASAAAVGTSAAAGPESPAGPALHPAGEGQMFSVAADPGYIYGGNEDGKVYVWDRRTRRLERTLTAPDGKILSVHADAGSDGFLYAAGTGNKVYLWRKGGDFLYLLSLGIGQSAVEAVFSDDSCIYAGDTEGYVYVWDRETLLLRERLSQADGLIASVHSDHDYLYAGSGGFDDAVYVREKPDFNLARVLRDARDDVNSIHAAAGRIYAAAARNIYVWDRSDFSLLEIISGTGWGMNAVSSCGEFIYGANENGRIYVWSKPDYVLVNEIKVSDQSLLWLAAEDDLLLAAGRDGRVYAWELPLSPPSASAAPTPEVLGRFGITVEGGVSASPVSPATPTPRTPRPSRSVPTPPARAAPAAPRTGGYDPVRKSLGYGLVREAYREVYRDFFGILLTTPTPPPTPVPTPTPVATPTPADPEPTTARVVINEINWGGTAARPDDGEWIELYNYGDASVNLVGWTIENQTAPWTITITGDLTIIPGGYLVLARGIDSTGNADFLYRQERVLSDDGARLVLKDAAGEVRDTVDCEREWFAGGPAVSMERIDPEIDGSNPNNWAAADFDANYPGPDGPNQGTPRARNSIAAGVAAAAVAGADLTLEDFAGWINFEEGRYFKLLEADYEDLHPLAAQLDYLPNTAFVYLATGWKPARDYFRRHLLAAVRDESFDWGGEGSSPFLADTAEAYLAMAAEGVFAPSERKEIEDAFRRLAARPAVRDDSPAAAASAAGLRAAVDYLAGGKEGGGAASASREVLSYDEAWSPPESSRYLGSLYAREMLRAALYRNRMTLPALDDDGIRWRENFARQVEWIISVFPQNGFHPARGEERYLNRVGHYILPLVAATSILDDEDPDHVLLARRAKWLAQRMFLYGADRSPGVFGDSSRGYHAGQWGPFPILLNPVHLWWFWNEDLPSLRPEERDFPGGVFSRSGSASSAGRDGPATVEKVIHRSGWEDESFFVMLDLERSADGYGFANSLTSLSWGPEEFLSGLVLSNDEFSPKMASLAEGLGDYRRARVLTWEDTDAYSRSVTRVEAGGDSWTREIIVHKRGRNEVEVIDTVDFPAEIRWHLLGEMDRSGDGAEFEIGETVLEVSWSGADRDSIRSYDTWSYADPAERWSYAGSPAHSLKLGISGPGAVRTLFRGRPAAAPASTR